jgi:peptidoglycan biosynthesis protein MviN/MurJ (putative lipid II flippase)
MTKSSRLRLFSPTLRRKTKKTKTLRTASFLILAIFLTASPVYADIVPPFPSPPGPKWLIYAVEAAVGETVAWLIGAELLWRLLRKKNQKARRVEIFKIMLVAMIVSFLIGLLFWKILGWI